MVLDRLGFWGLLAMVDGPGRFDRTLAWMLALAVSFVGPPAVHAQQVISPGVRSAVGGAAGSWAYFAILVPANTTELRVTMSGGWGDGDLYVSRTGYPTTSSWHSRSIGYTNAEVVRVQSPSAGWWYIGVRGYADFGNATLVAEISQNRPVTLNVRYRWERKWDGGYDVRFWIRNDSGYDVHFDNFDRVSVNGRSARHLANFRGHFVRAGSTFETTLSLRPHFAGRRGQTVRLDFDILVWVNGSSRRVAGFSGTARLP